MVCDSNCDGTYLLVSNIFHCYLIALYTYSSRSVNSTVTALYYVRYVRWLVHIMSMILEYLMYSSICSTINKTMPFFICRIATHNVSVSLIIECSMKKWFR
jgi:hypothetical protein